MSNRTCLRCPVPSALGALLLGSFAACLEPGKPTSATLPVACVRDTDCAGDEHCLGGYCSATPPSDGDGTPTARPSLVLLTDSVRFQNVNRGRTQSLPVRLANQGDGNLTIDRVDVSGDSGRVSASPDPNGFVLIIPPHGDFSLTVTFAGSDGVAFSAALTIYSDDPARPRATLPVSVEYTGRPLLVVTEDASGQVGDDLVGGDLDLGPIPEGLAPLRRLYLKNLGVGGMFAVLPPPAVSGDAHFTVQTSPAPDLDGRYRLGRFAAFCSGPGDCIATGGDCTGRVCMAGHLLEDGLLLELAVDLPAGVDGSAELRVPYASPDGSTSDEARISLHARGVAADLFLDPGQVDFGAVSVGFPRSAVVRIRNLTAAALDITRVALTGSATLGPAPTLTVELLHDPTPFALEPFDAALVRLDFVADLASLGDATAQLEVETATKPGEPYTVAVSGRARLGPRLVTEPLLALDAGVTHVRRPAVALLTLENTADLGADSLHLTGAHGEVTALAGAITVEPPVDTLVLAPGAISVLSVGCQPDVVGTLVGSLTLESDAPDNPERRFSVTCVGIDPTIGVRYQSRDAQGLVTLDLGATHSCRGDATLYPSPCLDVGELYLGASRSVTLWVDNTGVGPLTVRHLNLSPADLRFSLPAIWPLVVPQGGESSFDMTFAGSATAETAVTTLRFDQDDDDTSLSPLTLVASTAACDSSLRDCHTTPECASEQTRAACCRAFDDPLACGPSCTPCPSESHTRRTCVSDACVYACLAGWRDLDGNGDGTGGAVDDGCEYACTPTNGGVERCDALDNDCDGRVDNGLALADVDGEEAPATCTPGSAAGFLGWYSEADLGVVSASAGSLRVLADYPGRVYRSDPLAPAGDVDWLRLVFAEVDACAAVGFRLEASLTPPAGARYELCGRLQDPGGFPDFTLACDEAAGEPVFDACVTVAGSERSVLRFEWPETCGVADDRVLDLRVRAAPDATGQGAYSCESYGVEVSGASIY